MGALKTDLSGMADAAGVEERARQSKGTSSDAIMQMVTRALDTRKIAGGCLVDVGCGAGNLYPHVRQRFDRYIGVDVVRYEGFPAQAEFCKLDLDSGQMPVADGSADVVAAIEVIEHLENPRDFMRKLARMVRPGGWIIVTTPNQLSFVSLANLVVRQRFLAFQDVHYPAHLTALLEIDLRRIAAESHLSEVGFEYSHCARFPLTPWVYPQWVARQWPRGFSENLLLIGQRKAEGSSLAGEARG
jgi:2-polyprenyl-3-methyl-5-hydroxy-6-metoxy-1,4-benzoquinol methylase